MTVKDIELDSDQHPLIIASEPSLTATVLARGMAELPASASNRKPELVYAIPKFPTTRERSSAK